MGVVTAGMKEHPAAGLLPAMTDAEYVALKADIAAHGLREPVVTHDNKVLDGRHRLRACTELGVEPKFIPYVGDDAIAYVLSANVARRHLTPSQRAAAAAEATELYAAEAAKRMKAGKKIRTPSPDRGEGSGKAAAQAAKAAGAGRGTTERAKRVRTADPDLFEKVKKGDVTVEAAAKQVALAENYRAAIDEFPELAPDASPGLPEVEVVRVAADLRAVPEGPERELRRQAAATWHKAYAAQQERKADSDEPSAHDHAAAIVRAVNAMCIDVNRHGGAEWLATALTQGVDNFELEQWTETICAGNALLIALAEACKPMKLRSVR